MCIFLIIREDYKKLKNFVLWEEKNRLIHVVFIICNITVLPLSIAKHEYKSILLCSSFVQLKTYFLPNGSYLSTIKPWVCPTDYFWFHPFLIHSLLTVEITKTVPNKQIIMKLTLTTIFLIFHIWGYKIHIYFGHSGFKNGFCTLIPNKFTELWFTGVLSRNASKAIRGNSF